MIVLYNIYFFQLIYKNNEIFSVNLEDIDEKINYYRYEIKEDKYKIITIIYSNKDIKRNNEVIEIQNYEIKNNDNIDRIELERLKKEYKV